MGRPLDRLRARAAAFDDTGVLVHGRSGELGSVETWSSDAGRQVLFTTPSDADWGGPYFFADRLDIPLGRKTAARWDLRTRTARLVRGAGRRGIHVHVLPDVWVSDGTDTLEFRDPDMDRDRAPLARVEALPSGGWIATNDRGAIDGSADALDHLVLVVEGDGPTAVLAPHFAWPAFHVPGLLSAALEGRSVAPPGVRSAPKTAR